MAKDEDKIFVSFNDLMNVLYLVRHPEAFSEQPLNKLTESYQIICALADEKIDEESAYI